MTDRLMVGSFLYQSKTQGKKRKVASSAVECMEKLSERDPTKDLLEFYREENEKARRHELQLMQMIMSSQPPTQSVQCSTQESYPHMVTCLSHPSMLMYTAVSTKVVPQKRKSVRDNADWYYG